MGFNPEMGARPLRRVIQQKVEDPLSDALLGETFKPGDVVVVDMEMMEDETEIILRRDDQAEPETHELMAAM